MEILETQIYRGANYWAAVPALRFALDIGELQERPTNRIPGFCEKLSAALPTLGEHRCSVGDAGGLFQQLREGTSLLHVAQHIALELQTLAGQKVSYDKSHDATDPEDTERKQICHLVFQY